MGPEKLAKIPWNALELPSSLPDSVVEVLIIDCFIPRSAQLVIEVAAEQSDEVCGLLFALAGMKASGEICRN